MKKIVPIGIFSALIAIIVAALLYERATPPPHIAFGGRVANHQLGSALIGWTPSLIVQAIVTLVFMGGSLFVILSKHYDPDDRHWAYTTVGTLLGYWLHVAATT